MSTGEEQRGLGQRIHDRVADWVGRPGFWLAFVLIIASYPFIHSYTHTLPEPLPALGHVADFELTDEYGEAYGSKQLKYKMWVVASICTACPDQVAVMGERLFRIQHRSRGVSKVFRLISITRDPERDTPKALKAWASGLRYSPRMWTLLTGPTAHIHTILDDIFQTAAVERGLAGTLPGLESRFKVALVDMGGHVRGYFDIRTDEGLEGLLNAMQMVVNRGY